MYIHEDLMRIRQKEILEEAERYRLASNHKPSAGKPRRYYARLMMWIGIQLLNWGVWLTARFADKKIISESGLADNRF